MSGYINIYKLDPIKIKEKLYPMLISTELPEIYIPETERLIHNFKKFLQTNKDDWNYRDASFENIIQKLTVENFNLTYDEFTAINDWFRWYHRDKIDIDEVILDDYGLIEIGSLHTGFETSAFLNLGCKGIEDYLFPIRKPDFEWNEGHFPLNSKELILMIDYMLILCIKISLFLKDSEAGDMIKDFQPNSFSYIQELKLSVEQHLQSYLLKNDETVYHEEMKQMFEGYNVHFAYLLKAMKNDLGNYEGLLYKEDHY